MAVKRFYRSMTPEKASDIRRAYFSRELKQSELATLHGISQPAVSRIVSGKVWA